MQRHDLLLRYLKEHPNASAILAVESPTRGQDRTRTLRGDLRNRDQQVVLRQVEPELERSALLSLFEEQNWPVKSDWWLFRDGSALLWISALPKVLDWDFSNSPADPDRGYIIGRIVSREGKLQ